MNSGPEACVRDSNPTPPHPQLMMRTTKNSKKVIDPVEEIPQGGVAPGVELSDPSFNH